MFMPVEDGEEADGQGVDLEGDMEEHTEEDMEGAASLELHALPPALHLIIALP